MVVGLVVALVPIVPTPIPVLSRNPVPRFVSDGTWKRYVGSDRSLVFAPLAEPEHIDPMAWQGEALMGYRMPGGYFLGPEGPDRIGKWPVSDRHFAQMLAKVGYRNEVVSVTDLDRAQAQNDVRAWHTDDGGARRPPGPPRRAAHPDHLGARARPTASTTCGCGTCAPLTSGP